MTSLIEKVREKTRGRSRSIKSIDQKHAEKSDGTRDSGHTNTQAPAQNVAPRMASPTIPAWHVHKGARSSTDVHIPPAAPSGPPVDSQHTDDTISANGNDPYDLSENHANAEKTPARLSSLQHQQPNPDRNSSDLQDPDAVQYPYTVPRRKESLPHNRNSVRLSTDLKRRSLKKSADLSQSDQPVVDGGSSNSAAGPGHKTDGLPHQSTSEDLGVEVDQALANLSVNDKTPRPTNGTVLPNSHAPESHEHLRLPPGFKLGNSVKTSIDTQWRPAVTHEDIYHERTEIVQEAITRDIHVHHYYTYVQPIRVVEVLPAKHFRIDEKTGLKVEISAPAGWVMPSHLQPHVPDTNNLSGWSRHYLVNEQHPNGIPEAPPADPLKGGRHSDRQSSQTVSA